MNGFGDDETLTVTNVTVTNGGGTLTTTSKTTSVNKVDVQLTAEMDGDDHIVISGPIGDYPLLGVDTGAWHFHFTLDDNTEKNVEFGDFDAEDGCATCPPTVTGNQSRLISGVRTDPPDPIKGDPAKGHFVDNNNNKAKDGVVNVSFQWHFTCDDGSITIDTYDPVVPNGGKS